MKKLLIILLFLPLSLFAQEELRIRTTAVAISVDDTWSEWHPTSVLIIIEDYRITIFSEKRQVYDVIEDHGMWVDEDGDLVMGYLVVDQDGDVGKLRFIKGSSWQLYVIFNNVAWVYQLEEPKKLLAEC